MMKQKIVMPILLLNLALTSLVYLTRAAPIESPQPTTVTARGNGDLDGPLVEIELARAPMGSGASPTVITYQYVVIIDAGSSHTDLYIYKWPSEKVNGTGLVVEDSKMVCQPVLSNFKEHPENAGPSLRECLNFASLQVPQANWNSTQVLLGATAGMRVLASNNEFVANTILRSVLNYIDKNYYFITNAKDIAILSPENEGGFSWLAINYVKGILQLNANVNNASGYQPTWGSLDVGGASTQFSMTVLPNTVRPSFCVKAFGLDYKVYTRSFLCYGKNEAYRRYKALLIKTSNFSEPIVDPCRPVQYQTTVQYNDHFSKPCSNVTVADQHYKENFTITGGGDGDACYRNVLELFRQTMDLNPSACPFQDGECSFSKMKKGTVRGKFLGTGALYYDTKNLKILSNDSFSLSPFDAAGFRAARKAFCGKTNAQVESLITARPELKNFFIRHCFDATYEEVLLSSVYGLDDETLRDMVFAKNLNGVDIGWTLGWAIIASTDETCAAGWNQGN